MLLDIWPQTTIEDHRAPVKTSDADRSWYIEWAMVLCRDYEGALATDPGKFAAPISEISKNLNCSIGGQASSTQSVLTI